MCVTCIQICTHMSPIYKYIHICVYTTDIYMYMYIYIYVYVHIYICICTCICMDIYMYSYVYVYIHIYTYSYIYYMNRYIFLTTQRINYPPTPPISSCFHSRFSRHWDSCHQQTVALCCQPHSSFLCSWVCPPATCRRVSASLSKNPIISRRHCSQRSCFRACALRFSSLSIWWRGRGSPRRPCRLARSLS